MQARLMPGIEVFVGFDARPALVKFSDETTCIATHRNGQACRWETALFGVVIG